MGWGILIGFPCAGSGVGATELFRAGRLSSTTVEGFNNKAKLTTRKAFGFRSYKTIEIALYHKTLYGVHGRTGTPTA